MSFFIAARKDTQDVLEMGGRSPDLTGAVLTAFRAALCTNHGIADNNLSLLVLSDTDPKVGRILDGAERALVWSGGEVSDLNFGIEDTKRILKVTASKAIILADGIDTTTITVELWKADNSGIATAVSASADMPIQTPDGLKKVRVSIVNGTASRVFKTAKAGTWVFPAGVKRFGQVRVGATATVEAITDFTAM